MVLLRRSFQDRIRRFERSFMCTYWYVWVTSSYLVSFRFCETWLATGCVWRSFGLWLLTHWKASVLLWKMWISLINCVALYGKGPAATQAHVTWPISCDMNTKEIQKRLFDSRKVYDLSLMVFRSGKCSCNWGVSWSPRLMMWRRLSAWLLYFARIKSKLDGQTDRVLYGSLVIAPLLDWWPWSFCLGCQSLQTIENYKERKRHCIEIWVRILFPPCQRHLILLLFFINQ